MKNTLLAILTIFLAGTPVKALERNDSMSIKFHQGHAEIDTLIPGNKAMLVRLDSILTSSITHLNHLSIIGGASPEGSVKLNDNLSDRRAENILSFIPDSYISSNSEINLSFIGRDWNGLYNLANADPDIPFKTETMNLLNEISIELASENYKEKETNNFLERLKALRGGLPYRYLYDNIFPLLRTSRIYVTYSTIPTPDLTISGPETYPLGIAEYPEPIFSYFNSPIKQGRNFYMALKTNMLYDILALPSLSAEFYLGKNFSAVANWTYGWWDTDRTHRYWRAYGGDLAVRWWFGKKASEKPLTGHHLGIYGGILTYDFEFGGTGYMGGLPHETLWNRSLRMAGVEYGYSLPIGRRINIDFTIGIGYLGGKYIKYIPDGGRYLWQSTHKINWFGPTKAEISLVWLIGNGNYNPSKKGGGI